MSPAMLDLDSKAADKLAQNLEMKIPYELKDSLIGPPILGTRYFKTLEGDPTKGLCGYILNEKGVKIYQIEHQPTFSKDRFRKLNHVIHGECWEKIP